LGKQRQGVEKAEPGKKGHQEATFAKKCLSAQRKGGRERGKLRKKGRVREKRGSRTGLNMGVSTQKRTTKNEIQPLKTVTGKSIKGKTGRKLGSKKG